METTCRRVDSKVAVALLVTMRRLRSVSIGWTKQREKHPAAAEAARRERPIEDENVG